MMPGMCKAVVFFASLRVSDAVDRTQLAVIPTLFRVGFHSSEPVHDPRLQTNANVNTRQNRSVCRLTIVDAEDDQLRDSRAAGFCLFDAVRLASLR